jgi:PAS domain S-box-containing protein
VSLGTKTTALFAAVVLALATTGFLLLHFQERSLKQTIFEGIDGEAKIAAGSIEAFIDEARRESTVISTTLPMSALRARRVQDIESEMQQLAVTFPNFQDGIYVLDREGKLLVDYPPHPEFRGRSFAWREYYQRTIQEDQGVISQPYKSARTGLPVLTFTEPVHDANGQILAIVACSMNLLSQKALGFYRTQKFGNTGYLYVFDRSRLLIVHPEDDRVMTYVEPGRNEILEAAIKGFAGTGETINSKGVPMLIAVRPIAHTDWTVAIQVPQKEAYAPVVKARRFVTSLSLIAILLAIAISVAAIRHITRPLQQLESVASEIGVELQDPGTKGIYQPADSALDSLRTIRSQDEIGLLALSFLRLATQLHLTVGSLQRAAEDWHRTFNSVDQAVVTLDVDSRILRMNHQAEDWFKCSSDAVRERYAYDLIFGAARPKEWPEIATLKEQERIRWSQGLEQPHRIFEFTLTPISNSDKTIGAVLVISDITQRVESEQHVREIAKSFHIAERTLSILSKGLTEETPLEVASIIREETGVGAVAITDTEKTLAFVGAGSDHHLPGALIAASVTQRAMREKQVVFIDGIREHYECPLAAECPLGSVLVVPLQVDNEVIGTIKLYEPRNKSFLNINKSLGEGIARLLSNQLLSARYQQQKTLLMKSELKLVHAQINPHFLFNALNTIVAILRRDANQARGLLMDLSDFFRQNLKRSRDFSTLEEELDHANSYLRIEKVRFGGRLAVEMDIDSAFLKMKIPTFTLQPLIENAVKHGISHMLCRGIVRIHAYRENGYAVIDIEDNGGTFDEKKQSENGLGIKIVDTRIKSLMGNDCGTTVFCEPDKMTRVSVRIPLERCSR